MNNIGIGIDVVSIDRVGRLMTLYPKFVKRVLSEYELSQFQNIRNSKARASFLAGRWAIKEAGYKALSASSSDESLLKLASSFKRWHYNGKGLLKLDLTDITVIFAGSISHDAGLAIAVAYGPITLRKLSDSLI